MRSFLVAAACAFVANLGSAVAQPGGAELYVDPPSVRGASLSPDGARVALIRRDEANDDEQLLVIDLSAQTARPIMALGRGAGRIDWVSWKGDQRIVLGVTVRRTIEGQATIGSRFKSDDVAYTVARVLAVDPDGANAVQMFQGELRRLAWGHGWTMLVDDLPADPDHILISAYDNNGHGLWRADVASGRVERVASGDWDTRFYASDGEGNAVMRMDAIPDGSGYRVLRRAPGAEDWIVASTVRRGFLVGDSPDFELVGPGPEPGKVYVVARLNERDRNAMYLYDAATGEFGAPLYEGAEADVATILVDWRTRQFIGGCEFVQRFRCSASDPAIRRHLNALEGFFRRQAAVYLVDMSADGSKWLIRADSPTEPSAYFLYDRAQTRVDPIAPAYPRAPTEALAPTSPVAFRARDGAALWAYVTAAPGAGPRPMVVLPHGGPESRDYYGYDGFVQFLASRGYVVMQPNFRGSEGFGRAFLEAGHGQWGRRMQDDVSDATRHMIESGAADPARICIVGASYGGYAALAGAALTPDLYRCAVAIAGVSDLQDFLRSERIQTGRGSQNYLYWKRLIGDPDADRDALIAASPARQADRVTAPILLIHGEEDETVLIRQSEIMEQALREAGRPARFVRLADSDHYWDSWSGENRLLALREIEAFLAHHLGAR